MYHKLSHYKCAANLLQLAKENNINIKHVLYNEKKYKYMNIKSLFALVSEALKNWNIVEILINESKILIHEPSFNIWHVRILITELIFGKKVIDSQNTFGQKILQYESKFRELLSKQDIQDTVHFNKNLEIKVRYIKVNPIKETVDSVINIFKEEGWQQITTPNSYQEYLDQLRRLEPHSDFFLQDFHIPEVLVFPPGTELYSHDLYKNGSFLFMDKSSCLAPYLLRPREDSCLLDMCAAPGLKTIHLAGLVKSGKVYAVERDSGRFQSLADMVSLCGANNVVTIHKDVTKLETDQYADVEYILLDPSCSGSGMRGRQPLVKEECDKRRLYNLAGFQLTLLRFALTRFPAVKRIVYSTCSLNEEENEEVIEAALKSKYHDFKLVSVGKQLSQWIHFGSQKYSFGPKCIYSRPETDLTNGFFVAVFKRRKTPIAKDIPDSFADTNVEFNCDTKTNSKYSERMENKKDTNKCRFLPSSGNDQQALAHSTEDKHTKTILNKQIYNLSKNTQLKEVFPIPVVDSNKIKNVNKNISCSQISKPNELQKLNVASSINNSKKVLTKSRKKRLRLQKKKSALLQNSNKKKNKNKIVNVKNISDCLETSRMENTSIQNKVKNSNEAVSTISKAKQRYERLKKLKLKSNPCNDSSKLETVSKLNKGMIKGKNDSRTLTEDISNANLDIIHKKKHKKKHKAYNETETNQGDVIDTHEQQSFKSRSQKTCIAPENSEIVYKEKSKKSNKREQKGSKVINEVDQNISEKRDIQHSKKRKNQDKYPDSVKRVKEFENHKSNIGHLENSYF